MPTLLYKLYPSNVIACVTNGWFRFPAHQKGESFAIKHMENAEMNDKAYNVITLLCRLPHKKTPDKKSILLIKLPIIFHTIVNLF